MNRLKEEFNKRFEVISEPSIAHFLVNDGNFHKTVGSQQLLNEIWNWINQNYIPREDVEGLKMENIDPTGEDDDGYNNAVDIINQNIDNLFKDFKQVSNPLDKDYE